MVWPEACPVRRPRLASSFLHLVPHLLFPRCIPLRPRDCRLCLLGSPRPQLGRDPLLLGQPCRIVTLLLGPVRGFLPGLLLPVVLASAGLGVYLRAEDLQARAPAAGPALNAYVAGVDAARGWIEERLGGVLGG